MARRALRVEAPVTWLDAALPLLFVAWALGAGLASRRRASESLDEYFLAGRRLPGWQAGCSMAATQFAADTPLVVTGLVATAGLFSLWQLWSYGLAFLLLGFVFAPCWRRAGVLTDAELAEARYSGRGATLLRGVRAALFGVVFNCAVLAMVLFAACLFAEHFLFWDAWLPAPVFDAVRALVEAVGVPLTATQADPERVMVLSTNNLISIALMTGVSLLYSATGGLRSVVLTDVVQLAIMMGATGVYAWLAVGAAGGLGEGLGRQLAGLAANTAVPPPRELLALGPTLARDAGAGLVAVFALQWLLQRNADGTGYLAQRAMACRSDRDAREASVLFAFVQVVARSLLWVPLALALLVLFPPEAGLEGAALVRDREASFVRGMGALLPAGLLGLMLTGMLAAFTSTVDTHLNWGASYVANDLYDRLLCRGLLRRPPSPRSLVWVARGANLGILAAALAVMTQLESVQSAWKATLVLGAGVGVVTVLRWLWWRISAWGELAALVASFAGAAVALSVGGSEALQMLVVAGLATTVAVAVSLAAPGTDPARLHAFATRAQPPGFWGPFGPPGARHALLRGLAATAAASVSLFAALLAGLRLLVPVSGAAGRDPLGWALLALAVLVAPLWLRALGKRQGTSAR